MQIKGMCTGCHSSSGSRNRNYPRSSSTPACPSFQGPSLCGLLLASVPRSPCRARSSTTRLEPVQRSAPQLAEAKFLALAWARSTETVEHPVHRFRLAFAWHRVLVPCIAALVLCIALVNPLRDSCHALWRAFGPDGDPYAVRPQHPFVWARRVFLCNSGPGRRQGKRILRVLCQGAQAELIPQKLIRLSSSDRHIRLSAPSELIRLNSPEKTHPSELKRIAHAPELARETHPKNSSARTHPSELTCTNSSV